jgi:Tfp pilus assembly protein PilF/DNA-directed RNA polymerase subunit RPC12/RpoP
MDVRCGRCGTEYEFDGALVSERGTTVKCTNCGYQFKVHASRSVAVPERWIVRTASGRELVFTSLRDLQKGIAQRQVGPEDLLSRGNQPARALGSIAELEPFFNSRTSPTRTVRTLTGVAPPATLGGPAALEGRTSPSSPVRTPLPPAPESPPMRAPLPTAPISLTERGPRVDVLRDTVPHSEVDPPTIPRNMRPAPPDAAPAPAAAPAPLPAAHMTPTPGPVQEAYRGEAESLTESRFQSVAPASRRVSPRWIVALILVGVLALLAGTVGRNFISRFAEPAGTAAGATDARVAELLERANRLLEDGDVEGARAELDKASALSDKDATVATAMARLETIRADIVWLRLRLLDPSDKLLVQATHRQLGQRVGRAREATDAAVAVAPKELTVVRAQVDAFRLAGELSRARSLVAPIAENQSAPENAYTLAALDLAEAEPGWATIVARLRTAAAAERELGRARVALVYALARSDKLSEAQTELAKLEARTATHPLLPELKAFLERFSTIAADAGAERAKEVATVDPASLPVLDISAPSAGEAEPAAGDPHANLKQAGAALKRGDLDRAEQLYNAVLAKNPGNTEALAGLGDVARLRKDPETAAKMYDKVLKENPSYLPALMARADQKWDSGDKAGAITLYRQILDQAGASSSYGQKAAARIAAGSESSATPGPTPSATPGEPPSEPPPKEEQPHIDTTDLPEHNK